MSEDPTMEDCVDQLVERALEQHLSALVARLAPPRRELDPPATPAFGAVAWSKLHYS